jgi:hypothetical protein
LSWGQAKRVSRLNTVEITRKRIGWAHYFGVLSVLGGMTNRKRTRAAPQASATHEIVSFVSRTDRTLEPCHADSSLREKMGASWCFPTIFPDENFFLVSQAKDNKPGGKEDFPARRAPPSTSYADAHVPIPRSRVVLPLEQGTLVRAQRRDGEWLLARVVEVNVVQGAPDQFEYYLHFKGYNKRLDCWRPLSALDLDTVVPPQGVDSETESEEGEGHEMYDAETWQSHNELTRVKNVDRMEMGRYEMETWYWSPLPPEFSGVRKLYVCEYDLAFFKRRDQMLRHLQKVRVQHPPGMEIYRHNGISMFEVDGTKAQIYCENLCYIAKLFLDHKSLVVSCRILYLLLALTQFLSCLAGNQTDMGTNGALKITLCLFRSMVPTCFCITSCVSAIVRVPTSSGTFQKKRSPITTWPVS